MNRKLISITLLILLSTGLTSCTRNDVTNKHPDNNNINSSSDNKNISKNNESIILNRSGNTIETRYNPPEGYARVAAEENSYGKFLRQQKLKPYGESVMYHDGTEKTKSEVYDSVLQVDIGEKDLHQCADSIMLLKAEYLYSQGRYNEIKFHFVSGFLAEYSKWIQGYRINPDTGYYMGAAPDSSYESFREYMDVVFMYAGTLSMLNEAAPISPEQMEIGDIFLDRGHTIIILDIAENSSKEKVFLLAQSYMPAQETQVLINRNNSEISPWYSQKELIEDGIIRTPEWKFKINDFMRY